MTVTPTASPSSDPSDGPIMDGTPADRADIAARLRMHTAFAGLGPATVQAIASVARWMRFEAGAVIVAEGDRNTDIFLLVDGAAAAERKAETGGTITLNEVHEGDCVGEMSFLDPAPRAASVRAITPCTVIAIREEGLRSLPRHRAVVGELKGALATVVVRRARTFSDKMLEGMREQLAAKALQNEFGYFLVLTISVLLVSSTLMYLAAQDYVESIYDPGFTWQAVLLLGVPCLAIIRILHIPAEALGLRREGLWRSLAQSAAVCTVLTVPVVTYVAFFRPDGIAAVPEGESAQITLFFLLQYLVHTVAQEIGSRGLLQGLFKKFLSDTTGHRSIFLTSIVFSSLHLVFGLHAVILTFFASILFGYVYQYQKNISGVILMHYWLGVLAAVLVML